jgi:hypothetical protein
MPYGTFAPVGILCHLPCYERMNPVTAIGKQSVNMEVHIFLVIVVHIDAALEEVLAPHSSAEQ